MAEIRFHVVLHNESGLRLVRADCAAGDTHNWHASVDTKRPMTSHLQVITKGSWHLSKKPDNCLPWPYYGAGMHSDLLPDIVAGDYQYTADAPMTIFCLARSGSDFEYLFFKADSHIKKVISVGRYFLLGDGTATKGESTFSGPQLFHARTKNIELDLSPSSYGIEFWL